MDIKAALTTILARIGVSMPKSQLVQIRDLFDDPTFLIELKKLILRLDNKPDEKVALLALLGKIMREAEAFRDRRESERALLGQMGVGAGSGLIVGGIVALLNPTIGFFALVAVFGGAAMGGTAWAGARRLDDERTVYRQIGDRLAVILKVVEA